MDDGCPIHWQWRIGGEHISRFNCHSAGEAIAYAEAYAQANQLPLDQLYLRKLVHGWPSEWIPAYIETQADDATPSLILPAGLLSAMADQ